MAARMIRFIMPAKQWQRVVLALAVVMVVLMVLYLSVYGFGVQHYHSNTIQGAMATLVPTL